MNYSDVITFLDQIPCYYNVEQGNVLLELLKIHRFIDKNVLIYGRDITEKVCLEPTDKYISVKHYSIINKNRHTIDTKESVITKKHILYEYISKILENDIVYNSTTSPKTTSPKTTSPKTTSRKTTSPKTTSRKRKSMSKSPKTTSPTSPNKQSELTLNSILHALQEYIKTK